VFSQKLNLSILLLTPYLRARPTVENERKIKGQAHARKQLKPTIFAMKNLIFLLSLLFSCHAIFSQKLIETELSGNFKLNLQDALELDDGSRLLTGVATPKIGFDSTMAFVAKVDTALEVLWSKRFKGFRKDDFSVLSPLADGNVLVGGTMRATFASESGGSVFKIDTAGNIIWYKVYSDSYDDRVIAAYEQSDNSLFIVIRKGVTNNPTKVVHANSDGSIISSRAYEQMSDGLVVDQVGTNGNEVYYLAGDKPNASTSTHNIVILAMDDNGLLWSHEYDLGRSAFCTNVTWTSDGRIALAGAIEDLSGTFPTNNTWVMRLTDQGNVLWAREYFQAETYKENINDLTPGPQGGLLGAGSFTTAEGNEGFSLEIDSAGNLLWYQAYNQFLNQSFSLVDTLDDSRIFLGGIAGNSAFLMATSRTGESACSNSSLLLNDSALSVSLLTPLYTNDPPSLTENTPPVAISDPMIGSSLICARSVAVEDQLDPALVSIYPNPTTGVLHVEWSEQALNSVDLILFDLQGRALTKQTGFPGQEITIDMRNWPTGIYPLQLVAGGRVWWHKVQRR
jgi:hypothetical protein